ncbi:hypothetical protein BC936DRAFT_143625 [Jimgerdemannia flammicorona]|uniref:Transmembrane protein n=1 Tax=Jimgerdemannia flammicorona TaxID=994334 RepID=A0A432ZZ71_9FUNG|nr:hypothetical protein BC936DRAFT_143625 [Jimgerdemannia flammicorona]
MPKRIQLPICGSLVMILTSCRRRLNLDVAGADTILTIHGLMWGIVDWFVIFGLMVVVYRLWRVFRAYVGEVELVGSKSDAMRVRRLKRGFLKVWLLNKYGCNPDILLSQHNCSPSLMLV